MNRTAALIAALGLMIPLSALAVGPVLSQCTLTWNAVVATDLTEYRIYVSTTPGDQDLAAPQGPPITAPTTTTTCAAQGITSDGQKYVVVTAVGQTENESWGSNEVAFVVSATAPRPCP